MGERVVLHVLWHLRECLINAKINANLLLGSIVIFKARSSWLEYHAVFAPLSLGPKQDASAGGARLRPRHEASSTGHPKGRHQCLLSLVAPAGLMARSYFPNASVPLFVWVSGRTEQKQCGTNGSSDRLWLVTFSEFLNFHRPLFPLVQNKDPT